MTVYVNFIFFSIYLAYIVTQELLRAGHVIDSQKSIMILLITIGVASWVGKWIATLAEGIKDEPTREGVGLTTFIWLGYAMGLIFAPSQKLSTLALIPLLAIGMAAYRPAFFRAAGYTPFMAGVTALSQAASLAYILRIGGDFSSAMGVSMVLWLILASVAARRYTRHADGGWGAALSLGQATPVGWFFLNISNQVISYSPIASGIFLALAAAGFFYTLWHGYKAALAESPHGWILWFPAMSFGLSLMVNFNVVQSLGIFAANFDSWIKDKHLWYHIQPGFSYIWDAARPFIEFTPNEGIIFGVYYPWLLFEYLDSSVGGYILSLYLVRSISWLLFIWVTWIALVEGLKASRPLGFAIALTLAVTNIIPLQLYVPWNYSWLAVERMPMLFASFLVFRLFSLREERSADVTPNPGASSALAFVTGAVHALSLLYEPSFGSPSIIGLFTAVAVCHLSARNILAVAAGGLSVGLAYIAVFEIPLMSFFYNYPSALMHSGRVTIHEWGKNKESVLPCFEFKPVHQIYDAFSRSRLTLTLHHTVMISSLLSFVAFLPFYAKSRRHSGLTMYLFSATLAMYLSRGQSFTGIYMGPYTLLTHQNMTYPLFPAMLAYGLGLFWDMKSQSSTLLAGAIRPVSACWLALGVINGVHMQPDGMPGWLPFQSREISGGVKAPYISRGMGEALDHMYTSLGRKAVKASPDIPEFFARPYSSIRDVLFEENSTFDYVSANPPYGFKAVDPLASCAFCLPGPEFTVGRRPRIYGKSALFQWKNFGLYEYGFYIRSSGNYRAVYFNKTTAQTSITAENLPADGAEMTAEVRGWTKEGRPVRTLFNFTSLPETIFTHTQPIPLDSNDPDAPGLAGDIGYILVGKEAKIGWTGIGADKYEVSISRQRLQRRGSENLFIATTDKTSVTISGLPADCGNVYLHLEAYVDGKWKRGSYLLFSAPEEFNTDRSICGLTGEPLADKPEDNRVLPGQ